MLVNTVRIKLSSTTLSALKQLWWIILPDLNSILSVHFLNTALLKLVASLWLLLSAVLLLTLRRLLCLSIHGRFWILIMILLIVRFFVSWHVSFLFVLTRWFLIGLSHSFWFVVVILLFIILSSPFWLVIVVLWLLIYILIGVRRLIARANVALRVVIVVWIILRSEIYMKWNLLLPSAGWRCCELEEYDPPYEF